ncbi:MAG: TetR/AcrR family transcriptional regulator [Litorimonas sp.]
MDSATKILDIAERRMRLTGYNAVSYRDIASEIGIKSASLHYHFPKKEDLGVTLVQRYTERFSKALSQIALEDKGPQHNIEAFIDIYRYELKRRKLVCLCAVLGAEAAGLPERVNQKVNQFFDGNISWLTQQYKALGTTNPTSAAKATLSLLTGAMTISSVNHDNSIFDAAAESILQ